MATRSTARTPHSAKIWSNDSALRHPSHLARELAAYNLTITEVFADHGPEVVKKATCNELASLITDMGSLESVFTL